LKIYQEPSLHQVDADLVEATTTEIMTTMMHLTHDEFAHKLDQDDKSLSMMTIPTTMLDLQQAQLLDMPLDVPVIKGPTTNDLHPLEMTETTTTPTATDHPHHAANVASPASSNLRQKLLDLVE